MQRKIAKSVERLLDASPTGMGRQYKVIAMTGAKDEQYPFVTAHNEGVSQTK